MSPFVSVIIPCHNAEKFIGECLESVIQQTYTETEIICVENNSSDNTLSVLNEYQKNHPQKIIIISESQPGASLARNSGLAIAKGEWIQFLDADDILLPEKINSQINLISQTNSDLVVGNYSRTENNKTENIIQIKNSWEGLIKGRLGFTSSNLWKKSVLINVGGWDNIKSSQEAVLMFKILKQEGIVLFDEKFNTVKMERTSSSISKTNVKDNIIRYIELRISIWDYLKSSTQLTDHLMNVLKINVFDSIRILYSENKEAGIDLYNKYVKDKFEPVSSSSSSAFYLFLYKLMGFRLTQKILG